MVYLPLISMTVSEKRFLKCVQKTGTHWSSVKYLQHLSEYRQSLGCPSVATHPVPSALYQWTTPQCIHSPFENRVGGVTSCDSAVVVPSRTARLPFNSYAGRLRSTFRIFRQSNLNKNGESIIRNPIVYVVNFNLRVEFSVINVMLYATSFRCRAAS